MTRFTSLMVVGIVGVFLIAAVLFPPHSAAGKESGSGLAAGEYTGASQLMIVGRDGVVSYDDTPLGICHLEITPDNILNVNFPDRQLGRGKWDKVALRLSSKEPRAVWTTVIENDTYKATAIPYSPKLYIFRLEITNNGRLIAGAQQFYAIEQPSKTEGIGQLTTDSPKIVVVDPAQQAGDAQAKAPRDAEPDADQAPAVREDIALSEAVDARNGEEKVGDPLGSAQQNEQKPSLSVRVVGRVVDAESEAPINNVSWQGGLSAPGSSHTSWGHSFYSSDKLDDGKFVQVINWGINDRRRVLAAGYLPASLLDELPNPLPDPLVIEKTIRLKKGRVVIGTLRDHLGKPAANARVFFIPKGHRANIVEGIPGVDTHELPNVKRRDNSVSEVRTDDNGEFAVPAGAAGMLAASTDLVDLWPFDLPAEDQRAELQMPAPTTLTIDLSQWYLKDVRERPERALTPGSESPNQCWIWLVRTGSGLPPAADEESAGAYAAENSRWKACEYRRTMLVFAPGHDGKLSKGVRGGEVYESHAAELIEGRYRNENITTKITVALPPGSYDIARMRAGKLIDVSDVMLRAGEEPILSLARGDGAAVRGTVALPANSVFIRQPGEAPRKLDWTAPTSPTLTIMSADGKVREAAHINSDGGFFVATHLEPGHYAIYASAYLPESDQQQRRSGYIFAELEAKQELVIPNVVRDAAGPRPLRCELQLTPIGARVVDAGPAEDNAAREPRWQGRLGKQLTLPDIVARLKKQEETLKGCVVTAETKMKQRTGISFEGPELDRKFKTEFRFDDQGRIYSKQQGGVPGRVGTAEVLQQIEVGSFDGHSVTILRGPDQFNWAYRGPDANRIPREVDPRDYLYRYSNEPLSQRLAQKKYHITGVDLWRDQDVIVIESEPTVNEEAKTSYQGRLFVAPAFDYAVVVRSARIRFDDIGPDWHEFSRQEGFNYEQHQETGLWFPKNGTYTSLNPTREQVRKKEEAPLSWKKETTFTLWKLNPEFKDADFTLEIPAGIFVMREPIPERPKEDPKPNEASEAKRPLSADEVFTRRVSLQAQK